MVNDDVKQENLEVMSVEKQDELMKEALEKMLKLGRMPAQFVIDKEGKVRFVQYSQSMRDIATNEKIFHVLDG